MKTHSKTAVITVLLMAVLFVLAGCDNHDIEKKQVSQNESARMSLVSQRIGEMKQAGLLDSLTCQINARNTAGTDTFLNDPNVDMEKLNLFIYNTDEALAEIAKMEDGELHVRLIEAMFTGGTVGEIADIMAEISEEMANGYLNAIESNMSELFNDSETAARSAIPNGNIRDIRLSFYNEQKNGRAAYAKNLDNSTVNWYIGFCVATTAGVYASTSKLLWVSIPGIVAAAAGAGSMVAQLILWKDCADFTNFIKAIAGKDAATVQNILFNTPHGLNIVKITVSTIACVVAVSFSPAGKAAIAAFKNAWNSFVAKIIGATNINWTIFGIPIQPI
jgi:hypothetical protein